MFHEYCARRTAFVAALLIVLGTDALDAYPDERSERAESIQTKSQTQHIRKASRSSGPVAIDFKRYYAMQDPRKAADELYRFAIDRGLDLDRVPPDPNLGRVTSLPVSRYNIHLPSGDFVPSDIRGSFMSRVAELTAAEQGPTQLTCLLQFKRQLSINERISLLRGEIRRLDGLSPYTWVVRIRADAVEAAMDRPNVRWIGEYKAGNKLVNVKKGSTRSRARVVSAAGDREEFRKAMRDLGAKVERYHRFGGYHVIATGDQLAAIAELWWVKKIFRGGKTVLMN